MQAFGSAVRLSMQASCQTMSPPPHLYSREPSDDLKMLSFLKVEVLFVHMYRY